MSGWIQTTMQQNTIRDRRTCIRELKIKYFCTATFQQENEMNLQAGEYKPKVVVMWIQLIQGPLKIWTEHSVLPITWCGLNLDYDL